MIRHLLESYGYLALFLLVALEGLGVPLPGEAALLTAAAYAATGHLSIVAVIMAAAAGAIAGGVGGYWIGRTGGLALVQRYGRVWRLDETKLDRARDFFRRHGGKAVFFGRFVALLRMWAALVAGVARMPFGRFALYAVVGGVCWAAVVGTLGYVFGRNLPQLEHAVGHAGTLAALLVALIVALVLGGRWIARQRDTIWAWISETARRLGTSAVVRQLWEQHPRLWAFVTRRFAAGEYLGLHLTLGLGLSLGALWLFGGVAEDVIHHDPLTQFDLALAEELHAHASAIGVRVATAISLLGSPGVITIWSVALGILLLVQGRRLLLGGWIAALAGGGLLDAVLKLVFHRPRPIWNAPLATAHGWSFPSGHAMGSLIAYGMLAYLLVLVLQKRRSRIAVVVSAAVLVLLIGCSRLYLGVHYFSDVIGGYAAGAVWLAACISGLEVARRKPLASG
jgi:membrane protein DedA with SNARE-associated domain/membrane-associated phospholipid phosphatase